MSGIHHFAQQQCAKAIVPGCRKGNCRLDVSAYPSGSITVIDVDRHFPRLPEATQKPDFFVLVTEDVTQCVVVEMKDGKARAADVDQLRAGAVQVDTLFADYRELDLWPLLVHRSMPAIERKRLGRERVRFRGRSHSVLTCRCGSDLASVLR